MMIYFPFKIQPSISCWKGLFAIIICKKTEYVSYNRNSVACSNLEGLSKRPLHYAFPRHKLRFSLKTDGKKPDRRRGIKSAWMEFINLDLCKKGGQQLWKVAQCKLQEAWRRQDINWEEETESRVSSSCVFYANTCLCTCMWEWDCCVSAQYTPFILFSFSVWNSTLYLTLCFPPFSNFA